MSPRRALRACSLAAASTLAITALCAHQGAEAQPTGRTASATVATAASSQAAGPVLRVYNNNAENLVENFANGACTRYSASQWVRSILADDSGQPNPNAAAPDIIIIQQVRGQSHIDAIAEQIGQELGLGSTAYKGIVAWAAPEPWGKDHHCNDPALSRAKLTQTNGIIYNTTTLTTPSKEAGTISGPWSVGIWKAGLDCVDYRPANWGEKFDDSYAWKRTTAIAAQFTHKATQKTIGVASMRMPTTNETHPCAGAGSSGIGDSGIDFGPTARGILQRSDLKFLGIDANRPGIDPSILVPEFGMVSRGSVWTLRKTDNTLSKADYLFTNAPQVLPSVSDYTVHGTNSQHKALHNFVPLG